MRVTGLARWVSTSPLTSPFGQSSSGRRFPHGAVTVGDLAVATLPPGFEDAAKEQLSDQQVWEKLPKIVAADGHASVSALLRRHYHPLKLDDITIAERQFPYRVRADLQRAIDRLFGEQTRILHFCGVRKEFSREGITLSGCIVETQHDPTVSIPPEYEEIDNGEEEPVRVLKNGLWLLENGGTRFAVLLSPASHYGQVTGVQFHIERDGTGEVNHNDVDNALNEMLFSGGSLNLKLLGARQPAGGTTECSA